MSVIHLGALLENTKYEIILSYCSKKLLTENVDWCQLKLEPDSNLLEITVGKVPESKLHEFKILLTNGTIQTFSVFGLPDLFV